MANLLNINTHHHRRESSSPKWVDTSAPVLSPRRKLSVMDVATSPLAVNFHTWRINALTNNALRHVQFLERAQQAFDHVDDKVAKKALRVLKDLGISVDTKSHPEWSPLYAGFIELLKAQCSIVSDTDWLVAIRTFLTDYADLFEDFKDAFGIREEEIATESVAGDTSFAAAAAEGGKLSRRSSSKVTFSPPPEVAEGGHPYFPPTPAPLHLDISPFDTKLQIKSPSPMSSTPASPMQADPDPEPTEVCLNGHYIAYDLHVAMMDRPNEMRDLFARNPDIFENIRKSCCPSETDWENLQELFYIPRDHMDDLTWMRSIGAKMQDGPSLLAILKELVGYDMYEEVLEGSDDEGSDRSFEDEYEAIHKEDNAVEEPKKVEWLDSIVKMREFPEMMARLESDYPQFFANVKKALTPHHHHPHTHDHPTHDHEHTPTSPTPSEYERFLTLFFSAPADVTDQEWAAGVQKYMRSSQLLEQLREIAVYELDIDEAKLSSSALPLGEVQEEDAIPSDQDTSGLVVVKVRSDPANLRNLETEHPLFFNLLQKHLTSHDDYNRFIRALYAPRSAIPDDKWEALITHRFLSSSKRLRQMFREVVEAVVLSTSEIMDSDDEEWTGRFRVPIRGAEDGPLKLLRLEVVHPELFGRIKKRVGDAYGRFRSLLALPRDDVPDDVWAERVEGFLDADVKLLQEFASVAGIQQIPKSESESEPQPDTSVQAPPQPPSPTPSTSTSTQYAIRDQLPSLLASLHTYLSLKQTIQDERLFGKLVHASIEQRESVKLAAREGEADQNEGEMKKVLADVVNEVVGLESDVGKKFVGWIGAVDESMW
ncbi:uncharacterized protein SPPG_00466 [Spizellomyces punctatus DAOM BR117]|uniref:Uncharacterized protein n=1 Tax=Spizellomyces punctatus (strain DAOM BR117) TaxID=645134 RepID=A0A0L0HUH4_SPIPD|nr:uncharacterized protein SPPG_00466 [Spizellomyces punctatus DAOM BR117]KND04763.1 hypothetical protein SPPG_00466 [Spizellomyces punctatus DAOM BR117]|eukprot:XP_016612802.1 hypothetical protein SPPG_00466 [Spizellomyces punctatus DAOM BR117]